MGLSLQEKHVTEANRRFERLLRGDVVEVTGGEPRGDGIALGEQSAVRVVAAAGRPVPAGNATTTANATTNASPEPEPEREPATRARDPRPVSRVPWPVPADPTATPTPTSPPTPPAPPDESDRGPSGSHDP